MSQEPFHTTETDVVQSTIRRMAHYCAPGFQSIFDSVEGMRRPGDSSGIALGFIGCRRGAGTSTVSFQAAVCAATIHRLNTLLIDANFRSPTLGRKFSVASPIGLSNCLQDPAEVDLAVKETGIENLHVLPAGDARLKSSDHPGARFVELTARLCQEFQLLVIDLPEAGSQVNRAFQAGIDRIYLVGNPHLSSGSSLLKTKNRLASQNIRLAGLFLNRHPS